MGKAAAAMLHDATNALITQIDTDRWAEELDERDDFIDLRNQDTERIVMEFLAQNGAEQSGHLRYVGTAMRILTDFERMGDHAVNIVRVAHRIRFANIPYEPLIDLPRFSGMVEMMITQSTQAFCEQNPELARQVIALDDEVDVFYRETLRELQQIMAQERVASRILLCSHLLFVAHYLERIGDHCKNVAERVVALDEGQKRRKTREQPRPLVN
jgi:phosphate transport system protein